MQLVERIQRADFGEAIEFVLAQFGDAHREIVHAGERPRGAGAQDRLAGLLAEPARIAQVRSRGCQWSRLHRALPLGLRHVHRQHAQAVALRILDQDRGRVESHRLIVQHGAGEGGQVVALQIRAGIGQQRETGGVRFGKAVERERRDGAHDILLRLPGDAVARHAGAQLDFDIRHALFGALEAHGAAQLLGLAAGEAGGDHRHAQQLLLKQRHAQRPPQHRFERGMQAIERFPALPAIQIRVHHFADDRARADDRHLHHDVVKLHRLHARQAGHLRAAFHLEHADGVGLLQRAVDRRIVLRQVRDIALRGISLRQSSITAIMPRPSRSTLMMPMSAQSSLSHCTTTRPGMVAGSSGTTESSAPWQITMPPECWPEVARQVLRHLVELEKFAHARVGDVEAGLAKLALGGVLGVLPFPGAHQAGELFERGDFEAQRLADFARGGAAAIGDDVGGHGRAQLAEALVDVLDGVLALVAAGQVDIDIGPLAALFGEEALEEQVHADGVDGGDFERVADGAVGGRAAALRQNVVLFAEAHDVPHDQEVARQLELFDQRQFALDLPLGALVIRAVAAARAFVGALAQKADSAFRLRARGSAEIRSPDRPG